MKIAVLGGGHGCYAAAADLSEAGHDVRLWRRDAAALQPVLDTGSIVLKDADGARDVPIALASADIAAALRGAELILIPSPAIAQADIARAMAPHLVDGQVVFLPPGTLRQLRDGAASCVPRATAPTSPGPRPARCPTWRANTASAKSTSPCARCACRPASTRRAARTQALGGDPPGLSRACTAAATRCRAR